MPSTIKLLIFLVIIEFTVLYSECQSIAKELGDKYPENWYFSPPGYSIDKCLSVFGKYFSEIVPLGEAGMTSSVFEAIPNSKAKFDSDDEYILKSIASYGPNPLVRLGRWIGGSKIGDEISIGLELQNLQKNRMQMFMSTADWFRCNENAVRGAFEKGFAPSTDKEFDTQFILVKKVKGLSFLDEMLRRANEGDITFDFIRNVLFQVYFSLKLAYDTLQFTHFDLHADNVIFSDKIPKNCPPEIKNQFWEYCMDNFSVLENTHNPHCKESYILSKAPSCGQYPIIIDFGNSIMKKPAVMNRKLGPKQFLRFSPTGPRIDMRYFLWSMVSSIPDVDLAQIRSNSPMQWKLFKELWRSLFKYTPMKAQQIIRKSNHEYTKSNHILRNVWGGSKHARSFLLPDSQVGFDQIFQLPFFQHLRRK